MLELTGSHGSLEGREDQWSSKGIVEFPRRLEQKSISAAR